jgi:hypothetical protein
MANGKATDEDFGTLHQFVAEQLLAELKIANSRPACSECGSKPGIAPALFAQAIKFLKDNGIDQPARSGNKVDALKSAMPTFDDDNVVTFPSNR